MRAEDVTYAILKGAVLLFTSSIAATLKVSDYMWKAYVTFGETRQTAFGDLQNVWHLTKYSSQFYQRRDQVAPQV